MTILISGFPSNDLSTQSNSVNPTSTVGQTNTTQGSVANATQQKKIVSLDTDTIGIALDEIYIDQQTRIPIYRYKTDLLVDYITATRVNAYKLNVYVTEQGGNFGLGNALLSNQVTVVNGTSRTPEEMTTAILVQGSNRLDFVKAERAKNIVLKFTFDLSSNLKKETLNSIRYALGTTDYLNNLKSFYIEKRKELENYLAGDLRTNNVAAIDTTTNTLASSNEDLNALRNTLDNFQDQFKQAMNTLSLELLRDPADFQVLNGNYIGVYNALAGVSSNNLPSINDLKTIPGISTIRSALLNVNNATLDSNRLINDNDILSIPVFKTYNVQHVTEYVDIPIVAIGRQDFTLMFEVVDVQGRVVQLFNSNVSHGLFSRASTIPSVAPSVLTNPKCDIGKNYLDIKQMDQNGTSVKIYKKDISLSSIERDANYALIGTIPCTYGQDFIRFYDPVSAGSNPSFYRVTSVNNDLVESTVYGSAAIQNSKKFISKNSGASSKKRSVNISSLVDRTSDQRIVILVKDLPSGVISIDLTKKDISNPQKAIEYVENNRFVPVTNTAASISFVDNSVTYGRIYEYRVGMLYKDGTYKFGKTNHIVEYKEVTKNVMATSIDSPVIETINGNIYNIKFNIIKQVNKTDPNLIQQYLEEQGLAGLYSQESLDDKSNLMQLFGTQVFRTNKSTSEVEYFGFVSSDQFSDVRFGTPARVKPLQPGNTYEYKIVTYGRTVDTLFPSKVITKTDTNTGKSYSYKPSKFLNPVTLNQGNLVSANSLKRNHAASTFALGDILDIDTITMTIPEDNPVITAAKCTSVTHNKLVVEWSIKGNAKKIDHYAIVIQIGKISSIVAVAHSLPNTTNLTYVYNYTNNTKGAVAFNIIPIFFDGTRGTPFSTNRIVIK